MNKCKSCEDCISCEVCHVVKIASKMMYADVMCKHFIDKDIINRYKSEIKRLNEQLGAAYAMIGKLVGE